MKTVATSFSESCLSLDPLAYVLCLTSQPLLIHSPSLTYFRHPTFSIAIAGDGSGLWPLVDFDGSRFEDIMLRYKDSPTVAVAFYGTHFTGILPFKLAASPQGLNWFSNTQNAPRALIGPLTRTFCQSLMLCSPLSPLTTSSPSILPIPLRLQSQQSCMRAENDWDGWQTISTT